MSDTYTPEEFVQKLKLRGYVRYIEDARKYAKKTGKKTFTEDDFQDAYHALNAEWPEYGRIYDVEEQPPLTRSGQAYQQMWVGRL